MLRVSRLLMLLALGVLAGPVRAQVVGPTTGGAAALAQAERMAGHTKRVLMIAAHPDDEDTELLTYLVREEGAVAGYLSLSRGEGGQNLIGPELGEALGLIRSEELLAARRLDGARQFFTRAFDFGFSKSIEETSRFWPRDSILKDVTRIVRRFRPQILVSIFSGTGRDGHGQHQMAGWAAREVFDAAGDPARFPELQRDEGLAPWKPTKLYRSARFDTTGTSLILEGGILDPEIGQSYHQIAMRGRSLHRSQDMGVLEEIGPSPIRLALVRQREDAGTALFAGVDTAPPAPGTVEAADLQRYAAAAAAIRAGLVVDAIAFESRLVAGQTVTLRLSAWNTSSRPISATPTLRLPAGWQPRSDCLGRERLVAAGKVTHCRVDVTVPPAAPITEPYFLVEPRVGALYRWSGPSSQWGEPFDLPLLLARFEFTAGDDTRRSIEREVFHRVRDQALGEVRRPLVVVPRVAVAVEPGMMVWPLGDSVSRTVTVALQHAGSDTTAGTIGLELPAGWAPVAPAPFRLTTPRERRSVSFQVRSPPGLRAGELTIRAVAKTADGARSSTGVVTVSYPHIRDRSFNVASAITIHAASIRFPDDRRIGYVRGASDRVPEALAGVGLPVQLLEATDLERGDLDRFSTIVIGSRAYETEPALGESNGRLLDWVRQGGHLVVQYQQQTFFRGGYAPFSLTVGSPHDRVTDETAPVRLLEPRHQVWLEPNVLDAADWDGWVQERGLYFARTWDARFAPLLELGDPGSPAQRGGMLLARHGEGTYLYTGMAFFRQLPAGVPGAFRLFLNLLALR